MGRYVYAIVSKRTGNFFIEDSKLPIYWTKKVAEKRFIDWNLPAWEIKRIDISELKKCLELKTFRI